MSPLQVLVPLPLREMIPPPALFHHRSSLHGQEHVARVMVHAALLIGKTGVYEEAPRLWAAVYLHDLARTHDGVCHEHGRNAVHKLHSHRELRALFARAGMQDADYPAICTAVTHHSIPKELDREDPHYRLTALLKDADGLDRVRLGDLDPAYLRFPETPALIPFAQRLYDETAHRWPPGEDYFERLWPAAQCLAQSLDL